MTANEAMLIISEEVAKELGYIEVETSTITGKDDWFWGNREIFPDNHVKSCTYILPQWEGERDENKHTPDIKIDMQWGNPRLGIYYPDGSFCSLAYKDEKLSEALTFKENGLSHAIDIKDRIDKLLD